jgi:Bacterial Ig-like domain (group 3)
MTIRSALVVAGNGAALACLLLTAGVGGAAAAAVPAIATAPTTWGRSIQPPGVTGIGVKESQVNQVSCPSAGNCTAVGGFEAPGGPATPFAISEKGGTWQHAKLLLHRAPSDTARYLNLVVSCSSAGNCAAGGERLDGTAATVFVVVQKNGTWGPLQTIVGSASTASYPLSISCPKAGACAIGGLYQVGGQNEGWIADENPDGSWNPLMQPISSLVNAGGEGQINGVSCGARGYCVAVGYYTDSSDVAHGYITQERNHSWDAPFVLPGNPTSNLTAVSCDLPGDCEVAGNLHPGDAFVVREKAFTWSDITPLPGLKQLDAGAMAAITAISCRTKGNCSAGGFYTDAKSHELAFVVSEKNGKWARAIDVPGLGALNTLPAASVYSVSCASPGNCVAGGVYYVTGEFPHAFLVSQLNGTWHGVQVPRGVAAPSAKAVAATEWVSCGAVGSCAAVGYAGPNGNRGWIARGSVRQPTSAALALSTGTVRFGHEQGLKVSVRVTPGYAGPATGSVTVFAGSKAVCALTLRSGAGTCSPAAKRLAIGKYQLVARYAGNVTFGPSASAAKKLTVTK